ncbi:MAG: glycosyltransferase [Crocosphaera sp.]
MKKFIIIDHSLANLQGHHYECSISVAEAAYRQGYQPIIIANKAFPKSLYPNNIQVISAFEVDWFNNPVFSKKISNLSKLFKFLQNNPIEKIVEKINAKRQFYFMYWELTKPKLKVLLEKIQGSTSRLVNWMEKDILLLRSIPFSNTLWGILKIIWGVIRYIISKVFNKISTIINQILTPKVKSFKATLSQVLKDIKVTSADEIFIHTIGIEQVEDVYQFLVSNDVSKMPNFHILLRRDIDDPLVFYAKGIGLKSIFEQCYQSKLWSNKIQFYTDTNELIERYNSLSQVNLVKIPIPFRQEKLRELDKQENKKKPIHFVYLGDARPEKGYHYLPGIVESLWRDYIQPGKIKLTIQSNFSIEGGEGLIPQARLSLERYPESKVKLIKNAMSADDYYQLLAEADALILPYDPHSYRFRTSGVLTEALAAGKPVIVPQNSWLGNQVDSSRARLYENPNKIAEEVIKICENLEKFSLSAKRFSQQWREENSPDSLVSVLLSKERQTYDIDTAKEIQKTEVTYQNTSQPIPLSVPKVLLIIESDFLLDQETISDNFINQVEYLGLCSYDVYGLFFTNKEERKGENYEPFYHQVYPVIDKTFQDFPLKQRWIVNYRNTDIIPYNIDSKQYIQEILEQKHSLKRDLIERYNLTIPEDLSQLLSTNQFDIILLNSIISYSIIDRFHVTQSSVICEVSEILSYQYASKNNRDIDLDEYQLECELLNHCDGLLVSHEYELEKLQETINHPQGYVIPTDDTLEKNQYFQTMNKVFESLLKGQALSIQETGKKIAILYPWGDILDRKSGASKRVGLLIDYLKSQSYQVWLFTTGDAKDFRQDGVHYTYYQQSYEDYSLVNNLYKDAYKSWYDVLKMNPKNPTNVTEIAKESDHWLPWIYYQYRFDSGFINWVKKLAEWSDTVILEYPFWGLTVGDICHQYKTPLIITAHDILAQQLDENTLIGKIALAEEIKALKQADYLISVSQDDQAFLKQYQLASTLIPNPVDIEQNSDIEVIEPSSFNQIEKPFSLFVGSRHTPNIEAVKNIQQIAKEFTHHYPDLSCQFVIVGSCWEPEETNNFIALGKVSDQDLLRLYHDAALIVSPILSGTGTSLKTVEAMAYGKVLLGTTIAFRGYPVESGKEGIICDRLDEYAHLIAKLINDVDKQQEMEENAKVFAKNYDYRSLYPSYEKIISGTL